MNQIRKFQRGRNLIAIVIVLLAIGSGAAILVKERSRAKTKEAQEQVAEAKRVEDAAKAKAKQADQERAELEKQAAIAAQRPDPLVTSLKAVDALYLRWQDARKVAGSTGRMALSTPISNLQAIRRDAMELTVPPCLAKGKEAMIAGMDLTIEGILVFMQNPLSMGEALAEVKFNDADKLFTAFVSDRAMCPTPTASN